MQSVQVYSYLIVWLGTCSGTGPINVKIHLREETEGDLEERTREG